MKKNKNVLFLLPICLSVLIINFVFVEKAFASSNITSFLLNGSAQNVTFNPKKEEKVLISIITDVPVKFNTIAICSISNSDCSATSAVKYFTQTDFYNIVPYNPANPKKWDGNTGGSKPSPVEPGEYKIKVIMEDESGNKFFEFGQYSIFVDFSSASATIPDPIPDLNQNQTPTSTPEIKIVTKTVYVSTHSGEEDLSNYDEKTAFEVAAGRERMASVGSPLGFLAKYTLLQKDVCNPTFRWSFGDGFEDRGNSVTHTYKYAGEYQVVLSGDCGGYSAISRTIVKVTSPNISIFSLENGDIEIFNKDKAEINIGMWKIKGGQIDFIFPQDTIISADNKIILSKEDLKINNSIGKVSLNNPSGREVSIFDSKSLIQNIATSSQILFSSSTDVSVTVIGKTITLSKEKVVSNKVIPKNNVSNAINKSFVQTATVVEAVNSTTTRGFWANIIDIPVKSLKSFVHIFYDF